MANNTWIVEATELRQLPRMENPDGFWKDEYMADCDCCECKAHGKALKAYNESLSKMPTLIRADGGKWKIGDILREGVDFEVKYQIAKVGSTDWKTVPKGEYNNLLITNKRIVAIPLNL